SNITAGRYIRINPRLFLPDTRKGAQKYGENTCCQWYSQLYCTGGIYPPEISGGQRASGMVHGPEAGTDDALGTRLPARHLRELAVKRRRRLMEPGRYDMGRHRDLQAAVLGCKPDFQSHKIRSRQMGGARRGLRV